MRGVALAALEERSDQWRAMPVEVLEIPGLPLRGVSFCNNGYSSGT